MRQNNEDSAFVEAERGLFIVADGMGGHNAGEVASQLAVSLIPEILSQHDALRKSFAESQSGEDGAALARALESAMQQAGQRIYEQASKDPACAGMGTTCTVVMIVGRKGILGHVGDSRVYVLRKNGIFQLTEDHTFVAEQLRRGLITKEQAARSKKQNVLTRALGVAESMSIDTMIFDVDPGDRFLLCTDGLYSYFQDSAKLAQLMRANDDVEKAVDVAVDAAKARGGHDNITAVIVDVVPPPVLTSGSESGAERIAVLKKISLFRHLSYQELIKVISIMEVQRAEAGARIIKEGDAGDELFVCLAGELEVSAGGKHLAVVGAGGHVGEMALIERAPRSATVVCKTDVNILSMTRGHFHELIRREPVIGTKLLWSFIQGLSKNLRDTNRSLQQAMEELDERQKGELDAPFDVSDEAILEVIEE